MTVAIGAATLADVAWSDLNRRMISAAVPAGTVTDPLTTVSIGVQVPSPDTQEDMYFNYWELDYRRLFRAVDDQIDFKAETASTVEYRVQRFYLEPGCRLEHHDTGPAHAADGGDRTGGGWNLHCALPRHPCRGVSILAAEGRQLSTPASISLRPSTGLRNPAGGADTVIVTPAFLRPAAETLATWHRAHGRRTVIADLQDVYDEFNDGIRHPVAVRQMMTWASTNWAAPAPAYLVLMGDGHYNMKS